MDLESLEGLLSKSGFVFKKNIPTSNIPRAGLQVSLQEAENILHTHLSNEERLPTRFLALEKNDRRLGCMKQPGEKVNALPVRLTLHRWGRDSELQPSLMSAGKLAPACPRLNQDLDNRAFLGCPDRGFHGLSVLHWRRSPRRLAESCTNFRLSMPLYRIMFSEATRQRWVNG